MTGSDPCARWEPMLDAFADGELDVAHAFACEEHVAGCRECGPKLQSIRETRAAITSAGVRYAAPPHLLAQVQAALVAERDRAEPGPRRAPASAGPWLARLGRWSLAPSAGLLAASLMVMTLTWRGAPDLETELVQSHVRSLQVSHLTDVATSDQHTVKPWFNGKVDFAPPVVDLAGRGFPLIGGRLDYVAGRPVAALVYRRNGHVINLFIWPTSGPATRAANHEGYNLYGWQKGGLEYWAVSDLNAVELKEFQDDFAEAAP